MRVMVRITVVDFPDTLEAKTVSGLSPISRSHTCNVKTPFSSTVTSVPLIVRLVSSTSLVIDPCTSTQGSWVT